MTDPMIVDWSKATNSNMSPYWGCSGNKPSVPGFGSGQTRSVDSDRHTRVPNILEAAPQPGSTGQPEGTVSPSRPPATEGQSILPLHQRSEKTHRLYLSITGHRDAVLATTRDRSLHGLDCRLPTVRTLFCGLLDRLLTGPADIVRLPPLDEGLSGLLEGLARFPEQVHTSGNGRSPNKGLAVSNGFAIGVRSGRFNPTARPSRLRREGSVAGTGSRCPPRRTAPSRR